MLSRLWAAVSGWFLSRKPGEDAVSPVETSRQAEVAKRPPPEPAIEKLPKEAAAPKQNEVEASASSLPPQPPTKVAKRPLPEPAIERLPQEAAASKQKEVEASASSLPPQPPDKVAKQPQLPKEAAAPKQNEVEASASSLPPQPPTKVAKRPLPEPAIERLPQEAAASKQKEVEASASSLPPQPPDKVAKQPQLPKEAAAPKQNEVEASASSLPPQPPTKVAKRPLPEPAIERLPQEAAASKQNEVEASASSLPPQPPTKVAKRPLPEPATERLPQEAAASKQKEVEASASSLPPQPPAKAAKRPLPEPAIERLPKEAAASKQKEVEASASSLPPEPPAKVAHESAAERLRKELFAKRTGTDSSNFSTSSDNYRSRMEELKQNLKDKRDELAASGSNDSRGQAFISFSVARDGQKERARAQEDAGPLNIFSGVSERDQGTILKRRAVLKPPRAKTPEPESHESEDDSPWLSDQSASEHSFELRDWRLLDQPIQTLEMPEAKPAKKRKRGKKKKKPGRLEGDTFTAASQKRTEDQEGRADQVDSSQFSRQQSLDEGKDENFDAKKRKKKRKKDKKEKSEEKDKQFHDEALNEVEDSVLLEGEHQGEEEHAILSVSSGEEGHHEDHGVVECKFVAENDAALGLRRRIERHKTRALEEARKEEKKARKKAGKAAEKALKALRKAEKAEAKAEGFGFANKKQKTDASRTSQEAEWTALRELSKTCGQFQDDV